ncbi:MAG: 2-C-methyl-D-erythritol 4-phosphate cytidylyltransferase [Thermacetogeniaceae bacterium]
MGKAGAIIAAAGRGERMGTPINKVYLPLGDRPILLHSLNPFESSDLVDGYVVVVPPDEVAFCRALLAPYRLQKLLAVVAGGSTRQESVANGLRALAEEWELVAVHDGARPLLTQELLEEAIRRARSAGAAVVGVPVKDTVKVVGDGLILETPERSRLYLAQTPQVFRRDILARAYAEAERTGFQGTDDASLVERLGITVEICNGSYENIKITTPSDLVLAKAILEQRSGEAESSFGFRPLPPVRTGIGYDVHPFAPGRRLVLGGVEIPSEEGLDGHSDADVLIHALMDACLGAAGLSDIGHLFPPSESEWKDAPSLALLAAVRGAVAEAGFAVTSVDVVVAAEKPRLAPHISKMKERIAAALGIPVEAVGIKATTSEGLGFVGRGEGIAAFAVATVVAQGKPKFPRISSGASSLG